MSSSSYISIETDHVEKLINNIPRDTREIKKALNVEQEYRGMHVFAVAVDMKNVDRNKTLQIPVYDSEPLTHEVHNLVKHCLHVVGFSFHEIGYVPVNYTLFIDGVNWLEDVPVPFSVIKRYLDPIQKRDFNRWRENIVGENINVEFVQTLNT